MNDSDLIVGWGGPCVSLSTNVTPDQARLVKAKAKAEGISVSAWIRKAIERKLKQ